MLNKIGAHPSFTSKVRVVYDRDFGLKDFYASNALQNEIYILSVNGKHDTVTLLPETGRYGEAPRIGVQVVQYSKDKEDILYTKKYAYDPHEILNAYKEAKKDLASEENVKKVRKDVKGDILLYMV